MESYSNKLSELHDQTLNEWVYNGRSVKPKLSELHDQTLNEWVYNGRSVKPEIITIDLVSYKAAKYKFIEHGYCLYICGNLCDNHMSLHNS